MEKFPLHRHRLLSLWDFPKWPVQCALEGDEIGFQMRCDIFPSSQIKEEKH